MQGGWDRLTEPGDARGSAAVPALGRARRDVEEVLEPVVRMQGGRDGGGPGAVCFRGVVLAVVQPQHVVILEEEIRAGVEVVVVTVCGQRRMRAVGTGFQMGGGIAEGEVQCERSSNSDLSTILWCQVW
jgi:hypothetical protein